MKLDLSYWNKSLYSEFLEYLHSYQDLKYKAFNDPLLHDDTYQTIGVRVPILKKLAKEIVKGNYLEFIDCITYKWYEEVLIYGFILGELKDLDTVINMLSEFLPYNTNWAINDLVSVHLKIFKKYPDEGLIYIDSLLLSDKPWNIRFAIVLLLYHYKDERYLELVLDRISKVKCKEYYVQMSIAWLLSIYYVSFKERISIFLEEGYLDDWTYLKTLQKIIELKSISIEEREWFKRKKQLYKQNKIT